MKQNNAVNNEAKLVTIIIEVTYKDGQKDNYEMHIRKDMIEFTISGLNSVDIKVRVL